MNPIDKIRRELSLPSKAQTAWTSLTRFEKKTFISLAGLPTYRESYYKNNFDSFPVSVQSQISRAIAKAQSLADKFNSHLRPVSVGKNKALRAA